MKVSAAIIKDCIRNDRKAQYQLYRQCYVFLMPVCLRYEKNEIDARAILNLAFLKILNNLKSINDAVPFEVWCKRITINSIIDEYRKNKKRNELIEQTDFGEALNGKGIEMNMAEEKLMAEDLEKMLQSLPPMSRKVFNLHVIDGYSHKEIAEMLEISDGTSKWHVNNARQYLQKMARESLFLIKSILL